jgi:cytochrome c2
LKTIPTLHNANKPSPPYDLAADADAGKKLYYRYACYSCHAEDGVGVCDLTHARERYPTDEGLTAFITDASQKVPGTKMPTWKGVIADTDYAPLVKYVRSLERPRTAWAR